MASITSNLNIESVKTAIKYADSPHGTSLIASSLIDKASKELNITVLVDIEDYIVSFSEQIISMLLKCKPDRVYFRSCKVEGKFVNEYKSSSKLTENTHVPTHNSEFLAGTKLIMDVTITECEHVFKLYRMSEVQPRILKIGLKSNV